jgi:hypothetical protein
MRVWPQVSRSLLHSSDSRDATSSHFAALIGIKRYVPNKSLSKNPNPEYFKKEVKQLKVKASIVFRKRKF